MATNYINVKARLKWAKVYVPDEYAGAKNWKVNIYPTDQTEWDKIKKSGLALKVNSDVDGEYITVRRPTQKLIKDDLIVFTPPQIRGQVNVSYEDEEGNVVRQYEKGDKKVINTVGEQALIGNGSVAFVNICVYDTVKGKGHRLESLNVLELVEYREGPAPEKTEDEKEKEPPKEEKKEAKSSKTKSSSDDLNDEIPW